MLLADGYTSLAQFLLCCMRRQNHQGSNENTFVMINPYYRLASNKVRLHDQVGVESSLFLYFLFVIYALHGTSSYKTVTSVRAAPLFLFFKILPTAISSGSLGNFGFVRSIGRDKANESKSCFVHTHITSACVDWSDQSLPCK